MLARPRVCASVDQCVSLGCVRTMRGLAVLCLCVRRGALLPAAGLAAPSSVTVADTGGARAHNASKRQTGTTEHNDHRAAHTGRRGSGGTQRAANGARSSKATVGCGSALAQRCAALCVPHRQVCSSVCSYTSAWPRTRRSKSGAAVGRETTQLPSLVPPRDERRTTSQQRKRSGSDTTQQTHAQRATERQQRARG